MLLDGVIKYQLDFDQGEPLASELVAEINAWRNVLYRLGLVGHYKTIYQGAGYGNLSCRLDNTDQFVITSSHTGHIAKTDHTHYSLVTDHDTQKNHLAAKGPTKPSSEALSHAAIYEVLPNINFVFHVHSAAIWKQAEKLDIPVTSPDIAYGTVEMANEIARLCQTEELRDGGIISMGGHENGIISYGATAADAGALHVKYLVAAELEG